MGWRVTYRHAVTSKTMRFGDAWKIAGAILVLGGVIWLSNKLRSAAQNIGNPEFDMVTTSQDVIAGAIGLATPALVEQLILALIVLGIGVVASRFDWS